MARCFPVDRCAARAVSREALGAAGVCGCRACCPALDAPTQGLASVLAHRCSVASWPGWSAVLPVCGRQQAGHRLARTEEARPWLQPRDSVVCGPGVGDNVLPSGTRSLACRLSDAAGLVRDSKLTRSASVALSQKPEGSLAREAPGRTRPFPVARAGCGPTSPVSVGTPLSQALRVQASQHARAWWAWRCRAYSVVATCPHTPRQPKRIVGRSVFD